MSETINYITGGRLGDMMHALLVIKQNYVTSGKKGNLFLFVGKGGDGFSFHLEKVYKDTKDLILFQEYINSYSIYNGEHIDVNLNDWRKSPLLYRENWINILTKTFNLSTPPSENWLSYTTNPDYKDFTIIHRTYYRNNHLFPWQHIIDNEKCLFVTTNIEECKLFNKTFSVECLAVNSISELALVINSGKKFVGNMSSPLAIAHALGKPRLAELCNTDQVHYIGEEKYLPNYWYIKDNESDIPKEFLNI